MRALVCASANPDKVAEIEAIFDSHVDHKIVLHPRPTSVGEVDEDGDTLEANARIKARALVDATGLPALADDTGLFVDALDGAPGVYSARYAGKGCTYADNVAKLLAELGAHARDRRARFETVALVATPDGDELIAHGIVEGRIATEPRGSNGFGYDSVFIPDDGDGRTFAQMSAEEKNAISHRARAFAALCSVLLGRAGESI